MMPRAAAFASEVVPNDSFVPICKINYFLENKFPCVQKTNAYICQPLCQANPLLRLSFPPLCLLTARSTSPDLTRPLSTSLSPQLYKSQTCRLRDLNLVPLCYKTAALPLCHRGCLNIRANFCSLIQPGFESSQNLYFHCSLF